MLNNNTHNINYEQIAQEYKKNLENYSTSNEFSEFPEKNILESIVRKKVEEAVALNKAALSSSNLKNQQDSFKEILPDYALSSEEEIKKKVSKLIQITLKKGITKGIRLVLKEGNPYLLDLYHDALVDKLLEELKKRNLI